MPEFHKNQITWQAPEAQKVSLVKPDATPLAEAFNNLGRMAGNVAKSEMGYLDNQIVSDLDSITAEMNQKLDDANSLDADYSGIVEEAMAKWDATFSSYDGATQRRFLNNNPHAREAYELDINTKAVKKEQDQIYNRSKLNIAQWSSDVVNAPEELQNAMLEDRITAIQNLGLPIKETDDLVFRLRSEIDSASIINAISNDDFARANYLLENELPTKGAAEKAQLYQQLQNRMKEKSREDAEKEKLLKEAKEKGEDIATQYLLKEFGHVVETDNVDAARKLMNDYYYGRTISMTDEDGKITGMVYTSSTPLSLRSKVYNQMETMLKSLPTYKKYISDYNLDFHRLKTGLDDGKNGLNLNNSEYVTPEQYLLAKSLYEREDGWNSLEKTERDFVNRVLEAGYGSEEGLYMIDLNKDAKILETDLRGIDYIRTNPVVNFNALMTSMKQVVPTDETNKELDEQGANFIANVLYWFADEYKNKKFTNQYKINRGTRADALANMFVITASKSNANGMSDMALTGVPRTTLEDNFVTKMVEFMKKGEYNSKADYQTLMSDFSDVYKNTTGHDMPKEFSANLARYATIAYQGSIKRPDKVLSRKVVEAPLVSPIGEQKFVQALDAQRPKTRLGDNAHIVTTYKVPSNVETEGEHKERIEEETNKAKEEIKKQQKAATRKEKHEYETAKQSLELDLSGIAYFANEEDRQKDIEKNQKIIDDYEAKHGGYTVVKTYK